MKKGTPIGLAQGVFLLRAFLVQTLCSAANLDGYSFSCGGRVNFQQGPPYFGFVGDDEVYCPDAYGSRTYLCGSYSYNNAQGGEEEEPSLSVTLDDRVNYIFGTYVPRSFDFIDGILLGFAIDNDGYPPGSDCTLLALDWKQLEVGLQSVVFSCRPQNAVPGVSYEDNSFVFSNTGNVHFQSNLEIVRNNGNTIRRDHHGVFAWDRASGYVKLYAGPQNGEEPMALDGRLSPNGELYINGFTQENNFPCTAQSIVTVLPDAGDYPVPVTPGGSNKNKNNNDGNNNVATNNGVENNNGIPLAASTSYSFDKSYTWKWSSMVLLFVTF